MKDLNTVINPEFEGSLKKEKRILKMDFLLMLL